MYHPCAACTLRFATSGELAAHVEEAHSVDRAPTREVVTREPAYDWAAHRNAVDRVLQPGTP